MHNSGKSRIFAAKMLKPEFMKQIFSWLSVGFFLLLSVESKAIEAKQLVLQSNDGTRVSYLLRHQPTMNFEGNSLIVTSQGTSVVYAIEDTKKMVYETVEIEETEGIESVPFHELMQANGRIRVYTVNGLEIGEGKLENGDWRLVIDDLPAGAYIVKINEITYKIIKQ